MARTVLRRKAMGIRILRQHLAITGALALALCLVALLGAAGSKQAHALEEGHKPGQVIVKLNPVIGATIEEINADYGSTTLDDTLGSMYIYLLKPPDGVTEEGFVDDLVSDSDPDERVLYAEPNFVAETPEGPGGVARMKARGISSISTSPKGSPDRKAAKNLGLSCAAGISQGEGITVAVLDTGAQLRHPALEANFKGVKDYDFVNDDTNPSEPRRGSMVGHGTHVAGIVDRVAPAAKIMPLRVLNAQGTGDVFTIAKAISFAQRNGARVINLSLGSSSYSKLLQEMIENAITNGVVVVAAAGNSNSETAHYPAAGNGIAALVEGLVAVTSVDRYEKKSWFANYGRWVDIAAPGEGIRSAFPVDKYANWSGTSMATPFVSGQAALIHKVYGPLDPAAIEQKIRDTAREIDSKNPEYLLKLGKGHADVCKSISPTEAR
jgi:thermitase